MTTPLPTTAFQAVRQALLTRAEIALLDVREEAIFALAHPLFAAHLPLSSLEVEARWRIPRRDTPIVVYDDGEGLAETAARRLQALGYGQVSLLAGGLQGWREAGGEFFQDVNVPSKAFGELVEAQRHTPSLSAQEVESLLRQGTDVVVLDARPFSEYHTMSIPGAVNVPGAELVLRAAALAPESRTLIVVNCAGRTRSLIGTQSLVNAGVPNPVCALRNGTIGWTLAGQALDTGAQRRFGDVSEAQRADAAHRARNVADRARVARATADDLARFVAENGRTTYRYDVRTPEEFEAGHLPGFLSAPGGQLVQETDVYAPVRGARLVLADTDGVRANMTASWLAQMGWDVHVLEDILDAELQDRSPATRVFRPSSGRYRRPYEGTDNPHEAMQAYLDWEFGLVEQLARDGTHGFSVL